MCAGREASGQSLIHPLYSLKSSVLCFLVQLVSSWASPPTVGQLELKVCFGKSDGKNKKMQSTEVPPEILSFWNWPCEFPLGSERQLGHMATSICKGVWEG